jgi:hypothetical protein
MENPDEVVTGNVRTVGRFVEARAADGHPPAPDRATPVEGVRPRRFPIVCPVLAKGLPNPEEIDLHPTPGSDA